MRYSEYKVVGKNGKEFDVGVVQVDDNLSFVFDRCLLFMVTRFPDYYKVSRMVVSDRGEAVICSDYSAALKFANSEISNDSSLWRRLACGSM